MSGVKQGLSQKGIHTYKEKKYWSELIKSKVSYKNEIWIRASPQFRMIWGKKLNLVHMTNVWKHVKNYETKARKCTILQTFFKKVWVVTG